MLIGGSDEGRIMARTDQDMEQVSFVTESAFYLLWGGTVQLFWAVIVAPFAYLIASRVWHLAFHDFLSVYVVFNAFLLFWGCFGSYTFMAISFGKLYTSVDRLVDWYAFIPFGQWILDDGFGGDAHGRLIGNAKLSELQLLWAAEALPVWLLAVSSPIWVRRRVLPGTHSPITE